MDSLSADMVGRRLSDKEFKKYYNSYTKDFSKNPELDYQQDATEALRQNDEYQEYQVATKFAGALSSVLKGAS
jgi:hypothetical protein